MFDGPLGKQITNDINSQVDGLPKDRAFATLAAIINTETEKADEASVRVSYAYHRIDSENLWSVEYRSLKQWISTLDRDMDGINRQAKETLTRIKSSAATIRRNWGITLESLVEKPSRDLASDIAALSTLCTDKERGCELMESFRRARYLAEPEERGRGVPSTDRLISRDVREAIKQYKVTSGKKPSVSSNEATSSVAHRKRRKTSRLHEDSAYQARHVTSHSPEVGRGHDTIPDSGFSPMNMGLGSPSLPCSANRRLTALSENSKRSSLSVEIGRGDETPVQTSFSPMEMDLANDSPMSVDDGFMRFEASSPDNSTLFQFPHPNSMRPAITPTPTTAPTSLHERVHSEVSPAIGAKRVTVDPSSLLALESGEMIADSVMMAIFSLQDCGPCIVLDSLSVDLDWEPARPPSAKRRNAARGAPLILIPFHSKNIQHWSLFAARPSVKIIEHIDSSSDGERSKMEMDQVCRHLNWLLDRDVSWEHRCIHVRLLLAL